MSIGVSVLHIISLLEAVYCRDGADKAVQAAKHMIAAAAALLTCEHGPDETRPPTCSCSGRMSASEMKADIEL
jgi:hypothetical protein